MSHGFTGSQATFSIAGSPINGKLTNVKRKIDGKLIEDTGAGDTWTSRIAGAKDWEVTGDYILPLTTYTSYGSLVMTTVAVALKLVSSGANYFAGVGIIETDEVTAKFDESVAGTITIKGDGTVPTTL